MNAFGNILHFIKDSPKGAWPTEEILRSMQDIDSEKLAILIPACLEFSQLPTAQALFSSATDLQDPQLKAIKDTLIIEAIKHYQWGLIPILIKNGFNVNCQDIDKNTPLHLIISERDINFYKPPSYLEERTTIIGYLIKGGANINARNGSGQTPLFRAAKCLPELVKTVLKHRPDVNTADKWERTPLMMSRDTDVSKLLLSKGADIHLKDKDGETALDAAIKRKESYMVQLLKRHQALASRDSKESFLLSLPKFTFFSSEALIQEGTLEFSEERCDCCKKSKGCYQNMLADDEEIKVCPWCIESGKFAKKYKVSPHLGGVDHRESVIDKAALEELEMRTPVFDSFHSWVVHCHIPCIFLGRVGWENIKMILSEIEIIPSDFSPDDPTKDPEFLEALDVDSSPVGFLFKCTQCHKRLMFCDID